MTGQRKGRIETLACELAAGKTVEDAMLAAGYSAKTAAQGRIKHGERSVSPHNHPDVAARMDEIRAAAHESSRLTVDDIVAKLEQSFRGAVAAGKWSAATQAAMGQARVLGSLVDRLRVEGALTFDDLIDRQDRWMRSNGKMEVEIEAFWRDEE